MHETLYEEEEQENGDGDDDTVDTETRGNNVDQPGDEEQFNEETWEINVSIKLKQKMAVHGKPALSSNLWVGNKIGKHLKIDAITNAATRGRFARICVQINLNKSLPKRFKIGTFWQDIVYENVPLLCYECGRTGHKESICLEPNITLNQTPNTGSASHRVVTSNSETNQPQAPWKIVQTRRTRVRGIGQREYPLKSKIPSDSYPLNHKVNFKQTSNTFQALQVDENDMVAPTDSAETGRRQATIIRPKEVKDNGKSSNSLLPPHIHKDSMHEITEEESPQHSHARLRTPQSFTPQLVNNLTPVLLSTKQSIPNRKHGPLIRPKLHNTNTNRPGAPVITLTNAMSPETLPEAIFHFLDLSEINLALREEEAKLYIIMFSN
nr:hypothetical protein CFP56_66019 [Quercus suber]